MRNIRLALCLSAIALSAACSSTVPTTPEQAPIQAPKLRPGPPPVDFKSEFGIEGQRSNNTVAISIKSYRITPEGFLKNKVSFDKRPDGVTLWPEASEPGMISSEAGLKSKAFKIDQSFSRNGLSAYLAGQGTVELENESYVYSVDGVAAPISTSSATGYLVVRCRKADAGSNLPGALEKTHMYLATPKIVRDGVVFLEFEDRYSTSATEPTMCNTDDPSTLVGVQEHSGYGVSTNLAENEALVITGLANDETEKTGSVLVVVLTAQVLKPMPEKLK